MSAPPLNTRSNSVLKTRRKKRRIRPRRRGAGGGDEGVSLSMDQYLGKEIRGHCSCSFRHIQETLKNRRVHSARSTVSHSAKSFAQKFPNNAIELLRPFKVRRMSRPGNLYEARLR